MYTQDRTVSAIPMNKILFVLEKNYLTNTRVYSEKFPTLNDFINALVQKKSGGKNEKQI